MPKKPWSYAVDGFKKYFTTIDDDMLKYHVDFLMDRETKPFPSLQESGIDASNPKFIKRREKSLKGFRFAAKLMRDKATYNYVSQAFAELEAG